jgi:hypothetical protein
MQVRTRVYSVWGKTSENTEKLGLEARGEDEYRAVMKCNSMNVTKFINAWHFYFHRQSAT